MQRWWQLNREVKSINSSGSGGGSRGARLPRGLGQSDVELELGLVVMPP